MSTNVFDLQASLTMDTSRFTTAIRNAMASAEQLRRSISGITTTFSAVQANVSAVGSSLGEISTGMDGVSTATNGAGATLQTLTRDLEDAQRATQTARDEVVRLTQEYSNSISTTGTASAQTAALAAQLQTARTALADAETEERNAAAALTSYSDSAQDAGNNADRMGDNVQESGNQASAAREHFEKLKDSLSKVAETAWNVTKAVGEIAGTTAAAAGTAIAGLTKQSLDAAGSYEQLKGGVETLFGAGGMDVEEYAKSVSKSVDEVQEEYNSLLKIQETVLNNANEAYKTAGISANQYIETVTGFSAALIQATGRGEQQDIDALTARLDEEYKITKQALEDRYDLEKIAWKDKIDTQTQADDKELMERDRDEALKKLKRANEQELEELKAYNKAKIEEAEKANNASEKTPESLQRAAELSDMALRDMSDNANKMGTSMESIQNAYIGFAKENYMLLDNLHLGYNQGKEEMERLLKDAGEISGEKYNISSLEDVYNAIHVIQENMGIAGTTAKEAAGTMEGSWATMQAAWTNLVTSFGRDDMPMEQMAKDLVESVKNVANNFIPEIGMIVKNIGEVLPGVASSVFETLKSVIEEEDLGTALLDGIDSLVENVSAELQNVFESLFDGDTLSGLLERATGTIGTITDALSGIFTTAMSRLPEIVSGAAGALGTIGGAIWDTLVNALETVSSGDAIEQIAGTVGEMLSSITEKLSEDLPKITNAATTIIEKLMQAIPKIFNGDGSATLITALIDSVLKIANAVVSNLSPIIKVLAQAIPQIVNGVLENIDDIIDAGNEIIMALIDGISGDDPYLLNAAVDIVNALVDGIVNNIDDILLATQKLLDTIWDALSSPEFYENIFKAAAEIIAKLVYGLAASAGSILGFITEMHHDVGERIQNIDWAGIGIGIIAGIGDGILQAFGTNKEEWLAFWEGYGEAVYDRVQEIKEWLSQTWNSIKEAAPAVWHQLITDAETMLDKIGDDFSQFIDNALDWGKDLIKNFIDGALSMNPEWTNLWENVGGTIYDYLHHTHPDKGKLADDYTWMPDMIDSMVDGVRANSGKFENAIADLADVDPVEVGYNVAEPNISTTQGASAAFTESYAPEIIRLLNSILNKEQQPVLLMEDLDSALYQRQSLSGRVEFV